MSAANTSAEVRNCSTCDHDKGHGCETEAGFACGPEYLMWQQRAANTSAATARFEPIKPAHGNTYAARLERKDLTTFTVSTDGITVALASPYVGDVFMNNIEAAAVGRELLKAAGAQKVAASGWYCAHCQRGVDSREVTFSEQHEACGRYIADDEPPAAGAQDDAAALRAQRDELLQALQQVDGWLKSISGNYNVSRELGWTSAAISRATGGAQPAPALLDRADPDSDAPCAKLLVSQDGTTGATHVTATLYAPGLPEGAHDVYCVPVEQSTDAARYRWLRERNLDTIRSGGVFAGMTPQNVVLNGTDLDEAIDAAMRPEGV